MPLAPQSRWSQRFSSRSTPTVSCHRRSHTTMSKPHEHTNKLERGRKTAISENVIMRFIVLGKGSFLRAFRLISFSGVILRIICLRILPAIWVLSPILPLVYAKDPDFLNKDCQVNSTGTWI